MKKQKGFTLIELMIVVAIIGILAAVAIPAFMEYMAKGKRSEVKIQLNRLSKASKAYYVEHSGYPSGDSIDYPRDFAALNKVPVPASLAASLGSTDPFTLLEFQQEEDWRFAYHYIGGATTQEMSVTGAADLDFDSNLQLHVIEGTTVNGQPAVNGPRQTTANNVQ